jgi:hypothetical protein
MALTMVDDQRQIVWDVCQSNSFVHQGIAESASANLWRDDRCLAGDHCASRLGASVPRPPAAIISLHPPQVLKCGHVGLIEYKVPI